jgi:hypothetical protein
VFFPNLEGGDMSAISLWIRKVARFLFKPQTFAGAVIAYAAAFGNDVWKQYLVEQSDAMKSARVDIVKYLDANPETSDGYAKTISQLKKLRIPYKSSGAKEYIDTTIDALAELKEKALVYEKKFALEAKAIQAALDAKLKSEEAAKRAAEAQALKVAEANCLRQQADASARAAAEAQANADRQAREAAVARQERLQELRQFSRAVDRALR